MKIDWKKELHFGVRWKKIGSSVFIIVICLTLAHYWYDSLYFYIDPEAYMDSYGLGEGEEDVAADVVDAECNVYGIEVHGEISTYVVADPESGEFTDATASEDVVSSIRAADDDEMIKAILLEVDSYGGYPVAGEEIAVAVKNAKKPVVALIREGGASSAYMAVSAADHIIASPNSDVGGIGVTMSYLQNTRKNQQEGLDFIALSSAKFKDAGNSDKTLTAEEKTLLMRDVNIIHQNFVNLVAQNRGLDVATVEKLADGSTMLGQMALDNGLIDELGGISELMKYLESSIGEKPGLCW